MAKVAAVATGLAMATSMLSLAPLAHAACDVGTANLTVGSSGAAVTCLQQSLIANGYSIPAGATGYFGAQTKAAVSKWQAASGVAPTAGYFGSISRAHWNLSGGTTATTGGTTSTVAGCAPGAAFSSTTGQSCTTTSTVAGCAPGAAFSSTTGQSCTTTSTSGSTVTGTGYLTNESNAGDVITALHEGDPTTAVVGDAFTATNGDVVLQRVDATFDLSAITGGVNPSTNLNKYVSNVSVWLGNTELASMDPALGDKNNDVWTYRFTGLSAVIKSGTVGHIYVKVTPVTGIGSGENGAGFQAELLPNSIRAVGGDGISDTYVANLVHNTITVSSANTGQLTVTAATDNPVASQIAVSSSTTTGVKLLSFNLLAKNSNLTVNNLSVQFGTSDNNLSDVVQTVYLMQGATVLQSATLGAGQLGTTTFSNINQNIPEGSTQNYTILADLKGDALYSDGTTLIASTTLNSGWDVSDANGSSIKPSAKAVGYTQTLTATGMSVAAGTPTATVAVASYSGGVDTATLTIPFTVTAGSNDIYLGSTALSTTSANVVGAPGTLFYATTTTSTQGATAQPVASLSALGTVTGDGTGYYKVGAGTSRTFTLTAAYTASSTTTGTPAGFVGMDINSISYGTVAGTETSYYTSNLSTFKTPDVYVQKH